MRWCAIVLVLLAACEDKSRARHVEPKTVTSIVYGIDSTDDQTIRAAVNVLRQRLDKLGERDATVVQRGHDIVVELPGDGARVRDSLRQTAKLEVAMVASESTYMMSIYAQARNDPAAAQVGVSVERDDLDFYLRGPDRAVIERYLDGLGLEPPTAHRFAYEMTSPTQWRSYLVDRDAVITGANIERASTTVNPQTNRPEVRVELDAAGAAAFADITANNIGKKLAILVDGRVRSAPVIQSAIPGGSISITMGGSDPAEQQREAEQLASALSTGSLPAPLIELSVETISLP